MKKQLLALVATLLLAAPAWAAVDINTANQAELETISGVGPKKAQAIIEYRQKHGPFQSADDLDKVPGFGKKSVDSMKKDIAVGNAKAAASGKVDKSVKDMKEAKAKDNTGKK